MYYFERRTFVEKSEIKEFENRYKIKLPKAYLEFIQTVGSYSIFMDKYKLGIKIFSPNEIKEFSDKVFNGTGVDLFPDLLIIGSTSTAQCGFDLKQPANNFSVFYSDIPPENWLEDSKFEEFEEWIDMIVSGDF